MQISVHIRKQLRGVKIEKPVFIRYDWHEPNMKREKSNVAFAKKFIEDALIKCGALKGDGWAYVTGFTDDFHIDKDAPRIEITLHEERDDTDEHV